jgi:hypothetical protein
MPAKLAEGQTQETALFDSSFTLDIGKRPHRIYSHSDIDEIFKYLTQSEFPRSAIPKTSTNTGIPRQTLRHCHKTRIQTGNEDWFPLGNGNPNHRAFTPISEQTITEFIEMNNINPGIGAMHALEQLLCLAVYAGQTNEHRRSDRFASFAIFLRDFENCQGLALRSRHHERRQSLKRNMPHVSLSTLILRSIRILQSSSQIQVVNK